MRLINHSQEQEMDKKFSFVRENAFPEHPALPYYSEFFSVFELSLELL